MSARLLKPLALLTLAALAQQAAASGYHFGTQSVTAQGTANAAAAEADDASTLFYNTAGLAKLENHEISVAANMVLPTIKYSDAAAKYYDGSTQVAGSNSGKITDSTVFAPHVYGAYRLNERTTLGLGVYVPFGSSTTYRDDSVLRFHLNKLGLKTIAVEPAVAFKINDKHAVGVGVIAQYAEAKLRKSADWSSSMPAVPPALGGRPAFEAHADVKGKDWAAGFQLSWLYDINERARIGVNYRSHVSHTLRGTAEWTADGAVAKAQRAAFAANGYVASEDAQVKIVTPEMLSVHGMFKANSRLKLFADVSWTRHSRFKTAELKFAHAKATATTPATGRRSDSTTITPNWRNTFKVGLGGAYQLSEPLQLRAGIAFDQSPVRSADSRLNTLPDGNRIWFSAGVKYAFNKNHVLDVAYTHVHINDTEFKGARASGNDVDSKGEARAKFNNYANIFGVQYSYKF